MYTETERQIFGPHSDGRRLRFWDPMRVRRRLTQALQGEPNEWIKRFNDPSDHQAHDAVLQAARWAFEIDDFDVGTGEGPTEEEVESLLRAYLERMDFFARRGPNSGTSSTPADPTPSPPSCSQTAASPTQRPLASG